MKSALRGGKIPTPRSLVSAKARHQQLLYETGQIRKQLDDPTRPERLGEENFIAWAQKAKSALSYMSREAEQLALWLNQEQSVIDLLREIHQALIRLRKEVDLDPDEIALVHRLDVRFSREQ